MNDDEHQVWIQGFGAAKILVGTDVEGFVLIGIAQSNSTQGAFSASLSNHAAVVLARELLLRIGKLPKKLPQEPLIGIDATPDAEYPQRILRAHRGNCDIRMECEGELGVGTEELVRVMNEACEGRARLLNRAIKILDAANAPIDIEKENEPCTNHTH